MKNSAKWLLICITIFCYTNNIYSQSKDTITSQSFLEGGLSFDNENHNGFSVGFRIMHRAITFIEYMGYFSDGNIYSHNINFKMGLYSSVNPIIFSVATGVATRFYAKAKTNWYPYKGETPSDFVFGIPIQMRLDIHLFPTLMFGGKFQYAFSIDKEHNNFYSTTIYLAFRIDKQ
jgi:hypothetical protein